MSRQKNWVSARRNHRFNMGFTYRFWTAKLVFTKHAVLHIRNFVFLRRNRVQTGANRVCSVRNPVYLPVFPPVCTPFRRLPSLETGLLGGCSAVSWVNRV